MKLLETIAASPFAEALGWSLLHFLWQGALIAAAVATAMKLTHSARTRYAIACVALFAMPAVFAITAWLSIPHAAGAPLPLIPPPFTDHAAGAGAAVSRSYRDFASYVRWAAPVWLAGVVFVLLYRVAAWMFATRLRRRGTCAPPEEWTSGIKSLAARMGVSRPVILLQSAIAEAPVMIGYLRPVILVPLGMLAGLPADQAEAILLHELAHIRRADYLVNMLQSAVEALLFYHPAVWWISSVIRAERENCCDDLVLEVEADPRAYATALLTLEQSRWRAPEPAVAANDGDLVRRIRRVLRKPDTREFSVPVLPIVLLLAAGVVVYAEGSPRPQDQVAGSQTEVAGPYEKWLSEDVVYIITDQEKRAFKMLATDQERQKFIEQFWLRRDPTPGTPENEMRDEHYRRIALANDRFKSSTTPGWKTDRGRIYIVYGPPDEIEAHASGNAEKPFPFEQWRYKYIQGIGTNVILAFEDKNKTGDFRMTMDPNPPAPSSGQPWGAGGRHVGAVSPSPGVAIVSVQLDFADEVSVSGTATNVSGFAAAWFNQTVPRPARMLLNKELRLAPGSYVIAVTAKEMTTGATHSESVNVEVK